MWLATIAVYNLNAPTTQVVLKQGMKVKLEAGYMKGPYGTIFEGMLFQPTWERIDGIDYKITLYCLAGIKELTSNFASGSIAAGLTQRDLVARIASQSTHPFEVNAEDLDSTQRSSRGEVIFGQPMDYMQDIAKFNGPTFNSWFDGQALNIQNLASNNTAVPTLQYSPATGLIGTPQQTQDGVTIKVLLDPRATVGSQFQLLPGTSYHQAPLQPGSKDFPTPLDQNGLYVIAGIRHVGDSRGNVWDSELISIGYNASGLLISNP
jgi:hypothetical protein